MPRSDLSYWEKNKGRDTSPKLHLQEQDINFAELQDTVNKICKDFYFSTTIILNCNGSKYVKMWAECSNLLNGI